MRQRIVLATLLVGLLTYASASTITHTTGRNTGASELFEAAGTWTVTLAAYCYEGFGNVQATVFDDKHNELASIIVMSEGIQRQTFTTDPGRFYVIVQPSYWHVYNWELLVESGEGSEFSHGSELLVVSHAEHMAHLAQQSAAAEETAEETAAAEGAEAAEDAEAPFVPDSIWDGVFTEEQAKRGKQTFEMNCAICHGSDLISADGYAPDLIGFAFRSRWHNVSVWNRYSVIQASMPVGRGGTLSDMEYADIVAYILSYNKYPAGEHELVPGEHLDAVLITPAAP